MRLSNGVNTLFSLLWLGIVLGKNGGDDNLPSAAV
jgi:hypothetical protein